jgi:nucleoside-diphosphate-sugar epimerase
MKSSGEQLRSWCSVDDCAEAIVCILQKGKSGEAYNVADPESNYTIRELAEMIASIAGCKVIMQSSTEEEKKVFNPVDKSVFSTKKIEALGWKAKGNMYENIKAIISCLRNDWQLKDIKR